MTISTRRLEPSMLGALVLANNQRLTDGVGSSFHRSQTARTNDSDPLNPTVVRITVSAANASDLATSVTLVNQIKAVVNAHFVDTGAHNTALSAVVTTADATDLATGITLGNALKAAFNTHRTAANVHWTNDATNAVAAVDASDQATLITLLNEMKGDVNAHLASAPAGVFIKIVPA